MAIKYTKYRLIYFIIAGVLAVASIVALFAFGLKPGIDFTGGSILEVDYKQDRPSNQEMREKLSSLDLGSFSVQPTGDKGVILKMKSIDEDTHAKVLENLGINEGKIEEKRFESIGPAVGAELKGKTSLVIFLALLSMVVYIILAFRRVQRPIRSWQYGIVALITLFHDILIPLGVFAVLGKLYGVEITIPVVTALLTVLGYSINSTVVVFDRIRENVFRGGESFEEVVDRSLNQTLTRQLNTSLTTLFVLLAIFFFGGPTLKYFSLALILGVVSGMYSSFFISGSLLVSWLKMRNRK
jgi:preprotein translocase subunit SecF